MNFLRIMRHLFDKLIYLREVIRLGTGASSKPARPFLGPSTGNPPLKRITGALSLSCAHIFASPF